MLKTDGNDGFPGAGRARRCLKQTEIMVFRAPGILVVHKTNEIGAPAILVVHKTNGPGLPNMNIHIFDTKVEF